jgi:rhodanese-related sulfurtransferase
MPIPTSPPPATPAPGYRDIDPADLAAHRPGARIIDVREPAEFDAELGHIPGAELVPLATLEQAAAHWDRDAELVMVCRSGGRSSRAAATLARMGFRRVLNLRGGMLGYNAAQLPVERGRR